MALSLMKSCLFRSSPPVHLMSLYKTGAMKLSPQLRYLLKWITTRVHSLASVSDSESSKFEHICSATEIYKSWLLCPNVLHLESLENLILFVHRPKMVCWVVCLFHYRACELLLPSNNGFAYGQNVAECCCTVVFYILRRLGKAITTPSR